MKKSWIVVAVDGLAASGKGTISKNLAAEFDFAYLDTGKLYRALTLYLIKNDRKRLLPKDKKAFTDFVLNRRPSDIDLQNEFISRHTPNIASQGWARKLLLDIQRQFARPSEQNSNGAVLDGRDIGTVVCPDADVKLFVVADVETRARRRHSQMANAGDTLSYDKVLSDLKERDRRDSTRAISPLRPADDAVTLDTTTLSIDAATQAAIEIINRCRTGTTEIKD